MGGKKGPGASAEDESLALLADLSGDNVAITDTPDSLEQPPEVVAEMEFVAQRTTETINDVRRRLGILGEKNRPLEQTVFEHLSAKEIINLDTVTFPALIRQEVAKSIGSENFRGVKRSEVDDLLDRYAEVALFRINSGEKVIVKKGDKEASSEPKSPGAEKLKKLGETNRQKQALQEDIQTAFELYFNDQKGGISLETAPDVLTEALNAWVSFEHEQGRTKATLESAYDKWQSEFLRKHLNISKLETELLLALSQLVSRQSNDAVIFFDDMFAAISNDAGIHLRKSDNAQKFTENEGVRSFLNSLVVEKNIRIEIRQGYLFPTGDKAAEVKRAMEADIAKQEGAVTAARLAEEREAAEAKEQRESCRNSVIDQMVQYFLEQGIAAVCPKMSDSASLFQVLKQEVGYRKSENGGNSTMEDVFEELKPEALAKFEAILETESEEIEQVRAQQELNILRDKVKNLLLETLNLKGREKMTWGRIKVDSELFAVFTQLYEALVREGETQKKHEVFETFVTEIIKSEEGEQDNQQEGVLESVERLIAGLEERIGDSLSQLTLRSSGEEVEPEPTEVPDSEIIVETVEAEIDFSKIPETDKDRLKRSMHNRLKKMLKESQEYVDTLVLPVIELSGDSNLSKYIHERTMYYVSNHPMGEDQEDITFNAKRFAYLELSYVLYSEEDGALFFKEVTV